jgi:ubiquinone/menaquinone biosynthesis C-methylase UbiE
MLQITPFEKYAEEYDKWYEDYPWVYESELIAVKQMMLTLPENISGIEIGLGTGRFASRLGIREGIEPAAGMASMAVKRGIEIMPGTAELLPYRDLHFDFVLFVTICHLNQIKEAFKESFRVLKHGGAILVGFLDKEREIAQGYEADRDKSIFYKHATFYTPEKLTSLLKKTGFKNPEFSQTLFGKLSDINEVQSPVPGFGKGSFVMLKATKK